MISSEPSKSLGIRKDWQERYAADPVGKPIEILEAVAESRKCYSKGEQLDLVKASGLLIDDFRRGKLKNDTGEDRFRQ